VIRKSGIPVLAVRKGPSKASIKQILCPMNSFEPGKQALEYSVMISKEMNAVCLTKALIGAYGLNMTIESR